MSESNWMEKAGATRGKLALIAVLAVVLVGVVGFQVANFRQSASPTQAATPTKTRASRRPLTSKSPGNSADTASAPQQQSDSPAAAPKEWPRLTLEEIVAHDPLAPPPWYVTPVVHAVAVAEDDPADQEAALAEQAARRRHRIATLEQLREEGARVVVLTGADQVAAIGEQKVRIGDTIDGFQIIDITERGIVLAEIPQP